MTQRTDIATFAAHYDGGAYVVDCREPHEYLAGHVPGAVLVPMSRVSAHVVELPLDRDIYVICHSGNRSQAVSDFLTAHGRNAISVDGGTSAWIALGRPVVTGPEPGEGPG